MAIRFGPAGLGGVDEISANIRDLNEKGLRAGELAFTYGVYIDKNKNKKQIEEIKKTVENLDFNLSIHAPYWINLNSKEKNKIEASKKRILNSCEIGNLINAKKIVFHPGYYGKDNKEKTYKTIKNEILEIKELVKENGWKVELCPETTGKKNVFGKEDEILRLVRETKCGFTIDFAHLLARSLGKETYKKMYSKFDKFKKLHCHFSGIKWRDKGEWKHKLTPEEEIKKLLKVLPKTKKITIINESPDTVGDSIKSLKICKELSKC